MKQRKFKRLWLVVALVAMLISVIGASAVQTAGGSVLIREFDLVVTNGKVLHGQMYMPKDASSEHKLPLVIVQHGSQHNLEMQDMNMVELARRGYVVISSDTFGHGSSSSREGMSRGKSFESVVMIVEYACTELDFIDTTKIGVAGHSMGASIASETLKYYVRQEALGLGENKIAACLEIGYDPEYVPYEFEGLDTPVVADSHWGVVAGKFDEYFFRQPDAGNDPARILESQAALDFIHQADPSAAGPVENGTYYRGEINGKECIRVYYQNPEIHPQNVFSSKTAGCVVEFFYEALGIPDGHEYIAPNSQTWQWKQAFNCLGLVAVFLFLFPFAQWIMEAVPFFGELKATGELPPAPALNTPKRKTVYWITYAINLILPAALAMPVMHYWIGKESFAPVTANAFWGEGVTTEIATWSVVTSICLLAVLLITTKLTGKEFGVNIDSWGVKTTARKVGKSVILAVMTFAAAYGLLYTADFFFHVDFRFWLIAMRTFEPNKVIFLIAYAPAFILFYLVNSVLVNGANRVEGRPSWRVTLISCLGNAVGVAVLISIQYIVYAQTGTFIFNAMRTHNLFPLLVIVPAATIVTRKYFKETGAIYLGSITVALLIAMMQITQCSVTVSPLP